MTEQHPDGTSSPGASLLSSDPTPETQTEFGFTAGLHTIILHTANSTRSLSVWNQVCNWKCGAEHVASVQAPAGS